MNYVLTAILVAQLAQPPTPDAGTLDINVVQAHFKTELYSLCAPQDTSPTSVVELSGRLLTPCAGPECIGSGPTWELSDGGLWRVDWPLFVEPPNIDPRLNSVLLSPGQSQRTACLMATCAARNIQLEETEGGTVGYRTWVVSMAIALGLGLLGGGVLVGWLWREFGN